MVDLSRVMRKPNFSYAKTKTQISCAVVDSTLLLFPKYETSLYSFSVVVQSGLCQTLVGNPEDRYSHNVAQKNKGTRIPNGRVSTELTEYMVNA